MVIMIIQVIQIATLADTSSLKCQALLCTLSNFSFTQRAALEVEHRNGEVN